MSCILCKPFKSRPTGVSHFYSYKHLSLFCDKCVTSGRYIALGEIANLLFSKNIKTKYTNLIIGYDHAPEALEGLIFLKQLLIFTAHFFPEHVNRLLLFIEGITYEEPFEENMGIKGHLRRNVTQLSPENPDTERLESIIGRGVESMLSSQPTEKNVKALASWGKERQKRKLLLEEDTKNGFYKFDEFGYQKSPRDLSIYEDLGKMARRLQIPVYGVDNMRTLFPSCLDKKFMRFVEKNTSSFMNRTGFLRKSAELTNALKWLLNRPPNEYESHIIWETFIKTKSFSPEFVKMRARAFNRLSAERVYWLQRQKASSEKQSYIGIQTTGLLHTFNMRIQGDNVLSVQEEYTAISARLSKSYSLNPLTVIVKSSNELASKCDKFNYQYANHYRELYKNWPIFNWRKDPDYYIKYSL